MRVRLIVDSEGPNPDFDGSKSRSAENSPDRVIPAGTEIEDPQSFLLCRPDYEGITRAEPVDDEAKAQHAAWLSKFQRADGSREKTVSEQRAALAAADGKTETL